MLAVVPEPFQSKVKANDWVKATLAMLGGKGGGKAGVAQGTGALINKVDIALDIAENFAV